MPEVPMKAEDTIVKTTEENCHNTLEERLLEQAHATARAIFSEIEEDSTRDDKDGWLDYAGNWLDLKKRFGGIK